MNGIEFVAVFFMVNAAVDCNPWFGSDLSTAVMIKIFARPFHGLAGAAEAQKGAPGFVPLEVDHLVGQGIPAR